MIHAPERVASIRNAAASNLKIVEELESKIKDAYMLGRLKQVRHWFEDVENFFLSSLSRESRTADQESQWLTGAEWALQMGLLQLKQIQGIVATYGTNVVSVGQ
jgi:hypothetical protein